MLYRYRFSRGTTNSEYIETSEPLDNPSLMGKLRQFQGCDPHTIFLGLSSSYFEDLVQYIRLSSMHK